ncbi:helix-turn-helix domain-containing protein [Nonomuraea turcica]|uniref:helix-turn-helix domain-containing protein n=1 Tax=Nonomuraea sp. G32 TaxID=3067274 RepID=UPI00273B840C|nr:helix-turn-helix transcriptional regulator [Nonomuraea sp. G32]MDP4501090.1 helix-turn-helix transcriptional regulator [Nonomuraea sp. G32]
MSTSPASSVLEARKALAKRLRDMREDAELTAVALAKAAGWERTKVSKIEHAARSPSVADIRTWCRICGAQDQTEDLLAALRAVASMYVEWKRHRRTGLRQIQQARVPLYERTELMRAYCSQVIPGHFQTREYAVALFRGINAGHQFTDDAEEAAAVRTKRAQIIRKPGHRFAFVIEEAVLYYRMGGPEVMADQMEHLLSVMTLPSVSFGVIPRDITRSVHVTHNFSIFDDVQVSVELVSAAVTVTAPGEIARYEREFARLAEMAVYGEKARELIKKAQAVYRA